MSFVNYDDPDYVTANPVVLRGVTLQGLEWAFTSTDAANWFPLTRISHMLDCELFGLDSGWHHRTNVFLHALAALLLFGFLNRATHERWPSALVAALFALHPLHVDSVAWVAERKDVLCAVFWFAGLWAYAWYVEKPAGKRYALVTAMFCLGLMSKPMIVTFPFLLMVLDLWPFQRGWKIREKLPWFALSIAGSAITVIAQSGGGAVESFTAFPFGARLENSLASYGVYLAQAFWPEHLAVFYPFPQNIEVWRPTVAAIALVSISGLVWARRRRYPYLAVGWLWFIGTLVPAIGLVQVGAMAHADRYMYVPMVGIAIMVAFAGAEFLRKQPSWFAVAGAAVCLACVPVTLAQEGYWQNSETLFRHALAVTRDNSIAEHNLGSYLMDQPGRLPEATEHLQAALRINPDSPSAHSDLGSALAKSGQLQEAIGEFQTAMRLNPNSPIVAENLKKAQSEARKNPAETHYNDGVDRLREGRARDAATEFEEALKLRPDYAEAEDNLGIALTQVLGRESEAREHFAVAVKLDPSSAKAHYNLGVALSQIPGRLPEAIRELETAYRLKPDAELKQALDQLRSGAR